MKAEILKCPNKNYWYYPFVGKVVKLNGRKWVDDGLHERKFVPGDDDLVPLLQVSYTTLTGKYVCATDLRVLERAVRSTVKGKLSRNRNPVSKGVAVMSC